MNYVRSITGSVSKSWNSINPATLSGAIDVIVVEHQDGTLSCSPFHVRFGKFSLLRPYEKKVEFRVNNARQDYSMKLGEGGEAFFVFETTAHVPENLQTSPLVSPVASPQTRPSSASGATPTIDLEPLDLDSSNHSSSRSLGSTAPPLLTPERRAHSDQGNPFQLSKSFPGESAFPSLSEGLPSRNSEPPTGYSQTSRDSPPGGSEDELRTRDEAMTRATNLSKRLKSSNILSHVNETGDLMLDITGYNTSEDDTLRAEIVARQILSEETEGHYDIGSLIGADEKGNLWIYSSEEAKEAASRRALFTGMNPIASMSADAVSDPGYHSDDAQSQKSLDPETGRARSESDSAIGLNTPPDSPTTGATDEQTRSYAKTLRLTSEQLSGLNLMPGANPMSFSVNKATCQAVMYLWKHDVPIVVSDVDGTITKSDALGHVLNMFGRDWTHLGVAKLYCDIVANGYNILYLTSRSVGQADTTRTYLNGITQEGYKLPKGPVIMSPDRTMAALRREIYLRKPEVFKMSCLRDIMSLFSNRKSPFYAGFGNRLTDALSYRSVNIPSTRIFTINSNAEVSLDLLSLNKYKTGYTSMRETVDHFFPPVGMLVQEGGEEYTDFNYWRDNPLDMDEFSLSDSDDDDDRRRPSIRSEDEGSDGGDELFSDDMGESYLSRESIDDTLSTSAIRPSVESDRSRTLVQVSTGEQLMSIDDAADINSEDIDALDLITEATGRQPLLRVRDLAPLPDRGARG